MNEYLNPLQNKKSEGEGYSVTQTEVLHLVKYKCFYFHSHSSTRVPSALELILYGVGVSDFTLNTCQKSDP